MRIAGLGIDEITLDKLLDLLKTPQKSGDFLKNIKKETAALNKVRKEIGSMKSAKKYTDELKEEASKAMKASQKAIADIKVEENKAAVIAKQVTNKHIALAAEATKAHNSMSHTIRQYDGRALEIAELEKALIKKEQKIAIDLKKAEALKDMYTDKLTDLKQRMKGL